MSTLPRLGDPYPILSEYKSTMPHIQIAPATKEAYNLLHEGVLTLSKIEAAGIKIDTKYLESAIEKTNARVNRIEYKLKTHKFWKTWKKKFGDKAKLTAKQQYAEVLAEEGLITLHRTAKGNVRSDQAEFDMVEHPFAKNYTRMQKLIKANNTYLKNLKNETVQGFVHPIFDLHVPVSYRPSAHDPNLYNIPKRDPLISELVRSAIIPRSKNHVLLELDFKGVEVVISCCYNHDRNLINYVKDPSKDMHRDTAGDLFMCKKDQITKDMRFVAKNSFVFAEFYGSVYQQCCPSLWGEIERRKMKLEDGTPIFQHLRKKGIKDRGDCSFDNKNPPKNGTYEKHVQKVENSFWGKRFKQYAKWKNDWYDAYLETGYIKYLTGFVGSGFYTRNEIINFPIQGTAFHCLLWCEIEMVKWLIKHRMKSRIINQVYDSLLCDVHVDELDDFLQHAKWLMEEAVMKNWEWIIAPLTVDCEISEDNWFNMKEHHVER